MSIETEDQRTRRIRDAQIRDRTYSNSREPQQNFTTTKRSVSKQANKPSQLSRTGYQNKSSWTTIPDLLHLPLGGVRDVVIGLTYGLIPTLLAAIVLPGALKLVALLVLGIAGVTGYLIGPATT